jgi:glycyl-tRNA synthetase beta chain
MDKVNFLCEIGTEEIPAGYISGALSFLQKYYSDAFTENRIAFSGVKTFATPRRFVVCAEGVASAQKDDMLELKGPAADRAYDPDGKPSRALQGFMQGNGLAEKDLEKRDTLKGAYIFASKKAESKPTIEKLPEIIEKGITSIPFPKTMHWNEKKIVFPRPIRYLCILFNDNVVPFELDGIKADNKTRGHFIRSKGMLDVNAIKDYADILRKNFVILDQNERKELVRESLAKAASAIDCTVIEDEGLLETVTNIVEYPYAVDCAFKKEFLEIPDIVLITEMKEHQKYFALRDKSGKLSNSFFPISNNPPTDNIRKGNERVIAARFNDAGFFFREDRKHPLSDKVESLKNVMFHKELGSIFDKVERVRFISSELGKALNVSADDAKKIDRAALLCKADLNTAMVFEFTSLQGQIGRIYAGLDKEDPAVCDAIDDHYKPRFQGDPLPKGIVSAVLCIAEKIDNLFGSFSVGNIPKGSADPYALRRQSIAVVELCIQNGFHVQLDSLFALICEKYKNGKELAPQILEFIQTRAKAIFGDQGIRYDEVDAVLSTGCYDFHELLLRAKSINEFRKNEQFGAMLLSFKRMNNILSAFYQKNKDAKVSFSASLLTEDEEKKLSQFFESKRGDITAFINANKYSDLFAILISAKPVIDSFFDKIMVMADDVKIRDNRIALLESITKMFSDVIDFSKIAE